MAASASYQQLTKDKQKDTVACCKAASILMKMETKGSCNIVQGSVYGAAIAMPQVARSAGWSATFTALAIRSYMFLFINCAIQLYLLSMIGLSDHDMKAYAGQMHLCDMASNIADCPNGPNCKGPGGTDFTYPRLYDFSTWSTRVFVRDSMKALFPDKASEIDKVADPGEYGLEDYWCRVLCCFLFMTCVVGDLNDSMGLVATLRHVPSNEDSWVEDALPDWDTKDRVVQVTEKNELDFIRFRVAGMPLRWKIINAIAVVLPKFVIWVALVLRGFHFIMETAGIVDVIMSALAMTFVTSIDELLFCSLATEATKHIVEHIEEYKLFDMEQEETETDDACEARWQRDEMATGPRIMTIAKLLVPRRFLFIAVLMGVFLFKYYMSNCQRLEDGSMASKPLYYPQHTGNFNLMGFLFGLYPAVPPDTEPVWKMPGT